MDLPINQFKQALKLGTPQFGLWCGLSSSYSAEIVAASGFDWLLFDTEHSPADPLTVLEQLQAVGSYPVSPVVRPAANDPVLIKRFLDIGAQTLLIPMVQNAEEARAAADAVAYPPGGVRGFAGTVRANRFGLIKDYAKKAREQICLLVQVETLEAAENLEDIASTDDVDGIFIGPADLAASMGYGGDTAHPVVRAKVEELIARTRRCRKPVGILTTDVIFARSCGELGCCYTAVGVDASILLGACRSLRSHLETAFQD